MMWRDVWIEILMAISNVDLKEKKVNRIKNTIIVLGKFVQCELEYKRIINQEIVMYSNLNRPCRKNLTSHGLIYMGGEEQEITVINISISGVLVELNSNRKDIDVKDIFNILLTSTIIDLYLPEMRLAGECEVVRVDVNNDRIVLALEFKNIAYDIDKSLNKRKAYRKNLPDPGLILLNGEYHEFNTVNVSVEGLMIRLSESLSVKEGTITHFEFKRLNLKGEVEVIWVDPIPNAGTLIGLQYVNMNTDKITGLPRFA